MDIQIHNESRHFNIRGFGGTAVNKDYAGTAFKLMEKMWQIVKAKGLKNKGLNIWVYEAGEKVFAGVELDGDYTADTGLEHKNITLEKYAYYKHIGPYSQIKQAGLKMTNELKGMGLETTLPYIEVYGHWTSDETKLETELFMSLK